MSIRLLRHYGGRWLAWLVSPWLRLGETTRQQARKLYTGWLCSAWSDCWGPSTHCYSDHVMVAAGRVITEERRVITAVLLSCCCQSLHVTQSTTDAFFTHATRACSLASWVAQRDTFCPSLAIYFISTTWQMRLGSADRPLPAKISGSESASDCGPRPQSTHHRQFCLPQPHRSDTGNERLVT